MTKKQAPRNDGARKSFESGSAVNYSIDGLQHELGFYNTHSEQNGPNKYINLLELAELIRNPYDAVKTCLPLITPYNGAGKSKQDAETAKFSALVFDADGTDKELPDYAALFCEYGYKGKRLAFTTSSHGSTVDRHGNPKEPNHYKIIIPLSKPHTVEEYSKLSRGLCLLWGGDKAQANVQQGFYAPNSRTSGKPYQYEIAGDGFLTPECRLYQAALEAYHEEEAKQIEQAKAKPLKPKPTALGTADTSIIELINNAYSIEQALQEAGHTQRGKKWLSPHSTSGAAGGVILQGDDGKERFYSHHGEACPLSNLNNGGHALDVADVICITQYGGDYTAMIREEASRLDPEGQKQRQRQHMAAKESKAIELAEQAYIEQEAAKEPPSNEPLDILPPIPKELNELPEGLGALQAYIYYRMIYPSLPTAGFAALATLTAFAQSHITIDSYSGLGLNEQYMVLAKTGFGKNDLRRPAQDLWEELKKQEQASGTLSNAIGRGTMAEIVYQAPSSQQGLHESLEACNSLFYLSDEFAEWLHLTGRDPHKQKALGYLMEIYSSALGTVHPGHAVTNKYNNVHNPRVSILATSTAERMLDTMTISHADSGAYNRWVIYMAEETPPEKRYSGQSFRVPKEVIELLKWITNLEPCKMPFSKDAWEAYIEHDSNIAEPLRHNDAHLAGRLSEQAIKMAALFALAHQRTEIQRSDLELAYSIRVGLYKRAAAYAEFAGTFSSGHPTGQALEQVKGVLRRREQIYRSHIPNFSRRYAALSVVEQRMVIEALISEGAAMYAPGSQALLISRLA